LVFLVAALWTVAQTSVAAKEEENAAPMVLNHLTSRSKQELEAEVVIHQKQKGAILANHYP